MCGQGLGVTGGTGWECWGYLGSVNAPPSFMRTIICALLSPSDCSRGVPETEG